MNDKIDEGRMAKPPSKARVIAITVIGFVVGSLIVFGAIMPAEYNRDPLGLGQLSGLSRLWAPPEVAFDLTATSVPYNHEYPMGFRSDVIEIPLRSGDDRMRGNELEYKVRMPEGSTLIYEWEVLDLENGQEFYYDFHGHTTVEGGEMTVATYKQDVGASAAGSLIAPFEGVHGWYFQNQSVGPVVVRLKVSGFYELIPCCELGNESGIIANVPAAEAFGTFEELTQ
jgi:hypothetical protein